MKEITHSEFSLMHSGLYRSPVNMIHPSLFAVRVHFEISLYRHDLANFWTCEGQRFLEGCAQQYRNGLGLQTIYSEALAVDDQQASPWELPLKALSEEKECYNKYMCTY